MATDQPPARSDAHDLTLKATWDPDATPPIQDWRATCSCGWAGCEQDSEASAASDGRSHVAYEATL